MARFDFPKTVRLLKSSDFDRIFRQGCSVADGSIVIYSAVGESARPRLGLVVSRKCGNAVVRNRWKRALREAFRLVQNELPSHLELVVLPRRGGRPEVARLQGSFKQLAARAVDKMAANGVRERRP